MSRGVSLLLAALTAISLDAHAAARHVSGDTSAREYQRLFARLEKADVVVEGPTKAQSVLYVFFDANCFYCHLTWKALQPYERIGLQVRWVPVAYQQPSSAGRAAAIMAAPDRASALRANELGYNAANFDGGLEPIAHVPRSVADHLKANTRLMNQFGAPGTPALVWKDSNGTVHFKEGLPRLSELPHVTQLPAQPNDDPELAKFH